MSDAIVKYCPKCGSTGTNDDVFCEADGVRLEPRSSASAVLVVLPGPACPACGLGNPDAGDGYCSGCGHRLGLAVTLPPVPIGATVSGHAVLEALGDDDFAARAPDGETVTMAVGMEMLLKLEAEALDRLAGRSGFPRKVAFGTDPRRGPFLTLTPLPQAAKRLEDAASSLPVQGVLGLAVNVVGLAEAVAQAGFAWAPLPRDLYVTAEGALSVARVRCASKREASTVADVGPALEALGAAVLPMPAALGPVRLVRLLCPRTSGPVDMPLTAAHAREQLALSEKELAPPPSSAQGVAELRDAGLRRDHDEDATATASGETKGERWTVLVVCDGVSSSTHAEQASAIAAKTARDALAHFARSGDIQHEGLPSAMAAAIRAAHVAVCATPILVRAPSGAPADVPPPGTTLVAAIIYRRRVVVGWVGDSRAYWVAHGGAELLTRDHSWVNETVARGEMTEADAMAAPLAHALTRCLGPLEVGEERITDVESDVKVRDLPGAGHIILCSDGLWNYFPSAPEVAGLVRAAGRDASPSLIARCLVNHALARGGGDNVSVAVFAQQ